MVQKLVLFFLITTFLCAKASLKDEAYLHPVDAIAPYTLKEGEWIYAQSLVTIPIPSWAFVGITDNLTAELDFAPWLYGSFTELEKPIPSFNFRYKFFDQYGILPTFAVEVMYVYFWDTLKRYETSNVAVWQKGAYYHIKPVIGYRVGDWGINISVGSDYIGEQITKNVITSANKTISNEWNTNYSIGIDYRPSDWISYHIGYSQGATFTFLENTTGKTQLDYGMRIAPFIGSSSGFWSSFRIELVAINAYFADVDALESFSLPIYPYFYWQWGY